MKPGGTILDPQKFANNPYPKPISTKILVLTYISLKSILKLSYHLRLGLLKSFFPLCLPIKILKALLYSSFLATCPAHPIPLDLIVQTIHKLKYNSVNLKYHYLPIRFPVFLSDPFCTFLFRIVHRCLWISIVVHTRTKLESL